MYNRIKVGFCVAYDWYLLRNSLPLVYGEADEIYLSVDCERIGWDGTPYAWEEGGFRELIASIDVNSKVKVIEGNFHRPGLTAMQNENCQRTLMSQSMGKGGWHVQLDCDEYFLKFGQFTNLLRALDAKISKPSNVCCQFVTLFKEIAAGFLYVRPELKNQIEFVQIASKDPKYEHGRRNGHFNVYTDFIIVHQSWARTEVEVAEKVKHWGHSDELDWASYLTRWKALDERNFHQWTDFHPLSAGRWTSLELLTGTDFQKLVDGRLLTLTPWELRMKNSRLLAKARAMLK